MDLSEKSIWHSSYSVENSTIDDEHMQILQVYKELINLVENNNNDRQVFASILSKLTDFSLYHFKNEEKYMLNMDYPKFKEHKELHREYIYQVAMYNTELLSVNPPKLIDIINFVKNWLDNHILKEDIKYEQFKNERKISVKYTQTI